MAAAAGAFAIKNSFLIRKNLAGKLVSSLRAVKLASPQFGALQHEV
jgi:hypothetical protein